MKREDCMMALEQMILELPQYRKITNELCNKYIPDVIKNEFEQKQIYTEGDHSSSMNYSWDIYNNVPIENLELILDRFKENSHD